MRRDLRLLGAAALLAVLARPTLAGPPVAAEIATKMAGVADELNRKATGEPVQAEQKAIIKDLDALIASLEQECEKCKGNMKRPDPRQGMRDSMISSGPGGVGTLLNPAGEGKDWSKLSERERDRILQSMSEGFPPEYRTVLERYYRRLAEEKPAPAGARKAADAPAPAETP